MDKDRKIAFDILLDIDTNQAFSNLSIKEHLAAKPAASPGFVRELVYGVLENRIYLDQIIKTLAVKGLKGIRSKELNLLRMGIYQMRYMNSVPDYAAINETVNIAKKVAYGKDKFINGMLRAYEKKKDETDFLPGSVGSMEYLSCKYSYEPWIIQLWKEQMGDEQLELLLEAGNMKPALCIRANLNKTKTEDLRGLLEAGGFEPVMSQLSPRGILVKGNDLLGQEFYDQGLFSVQDEASMVCADMVNPQEGDNVLDLCAAPGGKTLAMGEVLQETGKVIACDIYEHKLDIIRKQALRLGLENIETICQDSTVLKDEFVGKFEKVLADVPCSGLGVIRHKPEIKLKEQGDLDELYSIQEKILNNGGKYVKKGGTLIYSTCTINRKENEDQIEKFIASNGEFEIDFMKQYLPHVEGTDGFFIAELLRK